MDARIPGQPGGHLYARSCWLARRSSPSPSFSPFDPPLTCPAGETHTHMLLCELPLETETDRGLALFGVRFATDRHFSGPQLACSWSYALPAYRKPKETPWLFPLC